MLDRIAEPRRIPLYPGFPRAREAALAAGAFGVAVSGAGPTLLAVVTAPLGRRGRPRRRRGVRGRGRLGSRGPRRRRGRPRSEARVSAELVCAACGEALPPLSRRSSCACGGLLDVVQHPRETGATLRARFDRRLRDGDPARTGQRRVALPRAAASRPRSRRHAPGGPHAASSVARRSRATSGHDDLALKHEGHNPTGSFKDRGMTVAVTPRAALRRHGRRVRLHGQHLGLDGGLRGAGRARGARVRPGGPGRRRQARPGARLRRPDAAGEGRLRRLPRARSARPTSGSASPCSTRSTRGASRDRRRSCSSCCSSWDGIRPTGSSCPRATSATPRPSARRWRRPARWA